MNSQIVFLSDSFYRDHPNPPFKEMEQKQGRPYIVFWSRSRDIFGLYLFGPILAMHMPSLPIRRIDAELIIRRLLSLTGRNT